MASSIVPAPPQAELSMPWDQTIDDPVAAIAAARDAHGDTFTLESGGTTYLFTFSPRGVRSFYALAEADASKGLADWQMLRRKVPDELFAGRRTFPHELFARDDTARYLERLEWAIDTELAALGDHGTIELFDFTRRLGHRVGLACWAGLEAAAPGAAFDGLREALDALDASEAFVRPERMAEISANDHAIERVALTAAEDTLIDALARRELAGDAALPALVDQIVERWSDVADPVERHRGIARDIVLVHLASMSNLFAALGWMLVDLVTRPDALDRVRSGDRGWTERCALESTRLAQRSVMMRLVVHPIELDDGQQRYQVAPGVIVATLLPLLNLGSAPGLDCFEPDRWKGRRLGPDHGLAVPELVTAFGHGAHTCPAQPFSLAAMVRSTAALVTRFELVPEFDRARPLRGQIGGVARSNDPCPVRYRRLDTQFARR